MKKLLVVFAVELQDFKEPLPFDLKQCCERLAPSTHFRRAPSEKLNHSKAMVRAHGAQMQLTIELE